MQPRLSVLGWNPMKKNKPLPPLMLDSSDFEQLSQEEKLSYLSEAFKLLVEMDAIRQGAQSVPEQKEDLLPLEGQQAG
jgi:hypothetical protein